FSSSSGYSIVSLQGELLVGILDDTTGVVTVGDGYSAQKVDKEFDRWNIARAATPTWNIFFARGATLAGWFHLVGVRFATLFLLSLILTLSARPWLHWPKRFTLRTLLIAVTAVAAVLGLVVWAVR